MIHLFISLEKDINIVLHFFNSKKRCITMEETVEFREDNDFRDDQEIFSHQELVMKAMRRVIEIGGRELVEGHYEEIPDNAGGVKIIYKEDTRLSFIEAIKTCERVMICDFDDLADENIKELKTELKEKKQEYLNRQKEFWEELNYDEKKQWLHKLSMPPQEDVFHSKLPFLNLYIDEEIEYYSEIFKELTHLSKRLDFYKAEIGEL